MWGKAVQLPPTQPLGVPNPTAWGGDCKAEPRCHSAGPLFFTSVSPSVKWCLEIPCRGGEADCLPLELKCVIQKVHSLLQAQSTRRGAVTQNRSHLERAIYISPLLSLHTLSPSLQQAAGFPSGSGVTDRPDSASVVPQAPPVVFGTFSGAQLGLWREECQ